MRKLGLITFTIVFIILLSVTAFGGTWEQDAKGWRYRVTEKDIIIDFENRNNRHTSATDFPQLLNKYAVGANIESGTGLYHTNADGYMATNAWYFDGERMYIYFGADGQAAKFENIGGTSEYKGPIVESFNGYVNESSFPIIRQINDGCKLYRIIDMDNKVDKIALMNNNDYSTSLLKYEKARYEIDTIDESTRNSFFKSERGMTYRDENGNVPKNCWYWISGKKMPAKTPNIITDDWLCYCFDENGILYTNCKTPDGYTVNDYGQQVIDGVIQRKSLKDYPQRPASTTIVQSSITSYKDVNGNTPKNCWYWISGKSGKDAVSKAHTNDWLCYCFDENGTIYKNCKTPDGYTVNENGQWVINGVVQTKSMSDYPQRPASMPIGSSTQATYYDKGNKSLQFK